MVLKIYIGLPEHEMNNKSVKLGKQSPRFGGNPFIIGVWVYILILEMGNLLRKPLVDGREACGGYSLEQKAIVSRPGGESMVIRVISGDL